MHHFTFIHYMFTAVIRNTHGGIQNEVLEFPKIISFKKPCLGLVQRIHVFGQGLLEISVRAKSNTPQHHEMIIIFFFFLISRNLVLTLVNYKSTLLTGTLI